MKRTFVMPEEKEVYYEKFKQLVPEVSGQLVAFIEDYVNTGPPGSQRTHDHNERGIDEKNAVKDDMNWTP